MVEILGLDEKQSKAVDELKEILQASGEYSPGKEGAKPSHSDATLMWVVSSWLDESYNVYQLTFSQSIPPCSEVFPH